MVLFRYLWTCRQRRESKARSEGEMPLPLTVSVSAEKSEIGRLLRRLPNWNPNYAMRWRREITIFKRETIFRMWYFDIVYPWHHGHHRHGAQGVPRCAKHHFFKPLILDVLQVLCGVCFTFPSPHLGLDQEPSRASNIHSL